jgi:O-succinylbenzoic acid--CoA ligase
MKYPTYKTMFVIDFSKDWSVQRQTFLGIDWALVIIEFIDKWLIENQNTFIAHTSGSTGAPKAITHSREALIQSADRTISYLKLAESSTLLLAIPATTIGGKMMIVRAILLKAKLICIKPSANPLNENFPSPIDFAAFTPMQVFESIASQKSNDNFMNIKKVIIGGGQISESLEKQLKKYPNNIYETFGMTETVSHIALRQISPNYEPYFSILANVKIKIGEAQNLIITLPLQDDISTNDIVELISKNQFKWVGRTDDIANTGGVKVNLLTIENKLKETLNFPFFISKTDDERLGETVVLVVESVKEYSSEFLTLSKFEKPRKIGFVSQFEYTASHKLIKKISHYKDLKWIAIE